MTQPRRGRPPHTLDPDASHAARLGAEIRSRRQAKGLTLTALAAMIGFSSQHLSEVELAKTPVSGRFVAACDEALEARGALVGLLHAVVCERALACQDRAIARRGASDALIGLRGSLAAQPATASVKVDPELVPHWLEFKGVLTDQDQLFGPHQVIAMAKRGVQIIGRHRQAARGHLRTDLMRVESRWEMLVAWLSDDAGDAAASACMERARALAIEAGDELMVAYVLVRQSERASRCGASRQAIALAQSALRQRGLTPQVRALSALHEALGHALAGEMAACQRDLYTAHELVVGQHDGMLDTGFEGLGCHYATPTTVLAGEARCWLWLGQPRKAVDAAQDALRRWPAIRRRGRGLQRAGLAVACAAAGQSDRAAHEGLHALAVARETGSARAMQELRRLDRRLAATPHAQGAVEFREAFATIQ